MSERLDDVADLSSVKHVPSPTMSSSEHVQNPELPAQPRKRKLKFPRTSNACNFCRKRKVRCSGTQPCEVCVREEVPCEYAAGTAPNINVPSPVHNLGQSSSTSPPYEPRSNSLKRSVEESQSSSQTPSRRNSLEPPQSFTHGHHVGPTSGVSFLYGQWNRGPAPETRGTSTDDEIVLSHAPLISYGDIPQIDAEMLANLPDPREQINVEQILDILDRYFQYISPTYRFHHHPTVRKWAVSYITGDRMLTNAQKACVLLICAQTLLHSPIAPGVAQIGKGDVRMSMACSERAKALLDKEPGPASLASIQARIGLCLYFLSTFRLNECRYTYSFAFTIATAMGIHRRLSSSTKINVLETECRKRSFWCLYILDGYLSVMLGRPRLIRDDDVDQPFPENVADIDLMSSEPIHTLPRHGNLEAFVAHARLAKLMARANDQLYPLYALSSDQLLQRSNDMLDALSDWETTLPEFLKPRARTMTGQRTFERQNTILKLGVTHARILATRRCLLMDFGHPNANPFSQSSDARAKRSIRECISAIIMILDTTTCLIEHGQCYGSFWSTQYVALVAISTLYVLLIQGMRHALPGDMESFLNVDDCFEKAKYCQNHLASLPPPRTQAERHHVLLAHLRSKVEKSLSSRRKPLGSYENSQVPSLGTTHLQDQSQNTMSIANLNNNSNFSPPQSDGLQNMQADAAAFTRPFEPNSIGGPDTMNDMSMFSTMLTPNSNSDTNFQYMLDFGWESLDTIGANMRGHEMYSFGLS